MIIDVKVRTNAGKQEIIRRESGYIVHLKSPPENNRANIELVKLLQNYFKRPVNIKSGFKSRKKVIEVS
jgi:uncharacterized protein (TIGR00251 family)